MSSSSTPVDMYVARRITARGFRKYIRKYPCCVVLIISPDDRRMSGHIQVFSENAPLLEHPTIVMITPEDSHHIPVARIPRILRYHNGCRCDNILLSFDPITEDVIRRVASPLDGAKTCPSRQSTVVMAKKFL